LIRDGGGNAIPGYALADDWAPDPAVPVRDNATCVPIRRREKSDVSELVGRAARVCFFLRNSRLYSFWFGD
jgi:hypothetical protein